MVEKDKSVEGGDAAVGMSDTDVNLKIVFEVRAQDLGKGI